jgi:predicted molibdopterin-dependent oxidoreductase YjgC
VTRSALLMAGWMKIALVATGKLRSPSPLSSAAQRMMAVKEEVVAAVVAAAVAVAAERASAASESTMIPMNRYMQTHSNKTVCTLCGYFCGGLAKMSACVHMCGVSPQSGEAAPPTDADLCHADRTRA